LYAEGRERPVALTHTPISGDDTPPRPHPETMPTAPSLLPATGQRWLVVAPHPDDETLGTGGLLQRIRRAGATVRLLRLTDGEANPWPQRWLERRWRIDADARARWAARRRAECDAALNVLGLDPAHELAEFHWPDGGVTAQLLADPSGAVARFRSEIVDFAPTQLVVPAADDRHPDHNAVPVLAALALHDVERPPATLAYRVHGGSRGDALTLELTPDEVAVKRRALACHRTQLALSAGRFEARVTAVEAFDADPFGRRQGAELGWSPVVERALGLLQRRWRWRLAGWDAAGRVRVGDCPAGGRNSPRPDEKTAGDYVFMKLEPERRGPWIYDSHGWIRRVAGAP
jgi:LmbE family N-acetylglucosaminyl deacetylase